MTIDKKDKLEENKLGQGKLEEDKSELDKLEETKSGQGKLEKDKSELDKLSELGKSEVAGDW